MKRIFLFVTVGVERRKAEQIAHIALHTGDVFCVAHHIDRKHKVGFGKGRSELHVPLFFYHFVSERADQLRGFHPSEALRVANAPGLCSRIHINVFGQVGEFAMCGRKLVEPVRSLAEEGMWSQETAEDAVVYVHSLTLCASHFHEHTTDIFLFLRQIFPLIENALHLLYRGRKSAAAFDDQGK